MKKQVELQNQNIEYTLRVSKRARKVRFVISSTGDFVVTIPYGLSIDVLERFILEKARWITNKIKYFKTFDNTKSINETRKEFLHYKEQARILAKERIEYFNKFYGFKINKIAIRNQKTRWGSCSQKGNLNFNYKIALLPMYLADYIIVHEICHLGEFNHSERFWSLIELTIPNHAELKRELKKSRASVV